MKKTIQSKNAPAPIGPYSQAVQTGNMVFVSGQIALDAETGEMVDENISKETQKVMENIKAVLQEAGAGMNNIVKSSIFLSDMNNFNHVNAVYSNYFEENPPARETVEVSRLPKDVSVEISVIAVLD
ncbi:MAG: RidA family protein [Bacteroidia bacterium]|nr:RidA family protein [Bacteroidia bacterium]